MAGRQFKRASRTALMVATLLGAASAALAAAAPGYDFAYRLSGDRRVAPLQVFDDGQSTWLQFNAGQALPAVFALADGASRLVPYTQQGPYVVLTGTAPRLVLRIGDIEAQVDYAGAQARSGIATTEAAPSPQWLPAPSPSPLRSGALAMAPDSATRSARGSTARETAPAGDRDGLPTAGVGGRSGASVAMADAAVGPVASALPVAAGPNPVSALHFDAGPADQNMRRALVRWAREAGWVFGAEHWSVDVDIPLTGSAAFGGDFRQAVRGLLGATELGERPLQPCFYANQVLRVVPLAQPCDRTLAPVGADPVRS